MEAQDPADCGGDAGNAEHDERGVADSFLDEPCEHRREEVETDDDCLMCTPPAYSVTNQGLALMAIIGQRRCDLPC